MIICVVANDWRVLRPLCKMKAVVVFAVLLASATAVPLGCRTFYCMSGQPCGIPLPDCANGFERYARLESWMKLLLDHRYVIGMAPVVRSATEFVVDFGDRCSVVFRVQTPSEPIPDDSCIAANNVSDEHFIDC